MNFKDYISKDAISSKWKIDAKDLEMFMSEHFSNVIYDIINGNEIHIRTGRMTIHEKHLESTNDGWIFPVKIAVCDDILDVRAPSISDYSFLPSISKSLQITNPLPQTEELLTFLPETITDVLSLDVYLHTLHNIHKTVKNCRHFSGDPSVRSSVLGLLLFKDLRSISFNVGPKGKYPQLEAVRDILRNYIMDNDVIGAKEELMTNGLKEYAKL